MDRRSFLKNAGLVTLSLQVTSIALAQTGQNVPSVDDALTFRSGPSRFANIPGHVHYISIARGYFEYPPADGVTLKTTWAYLHRHTVKLTQTQLKQIDAGQTLSISDTVHDHTYTISLAGIDE